MSRLFTKHIASILPALKWRHFGVGALQAYLSEEGQTEQRIHIWHPALVRDGIQGYGDCHNHRFSFVSTVLCGAILNTLWATQESDSGDYDMWAVENARAAHARLGSHDGQVRVVGRCHAVAHEPLRTPAGSCYDFQRGEYHSTKAEGLTITLVTKFDQTDTPARILCPHGEPLVHAFGGPQPDIAAVVRDAVQALGAPQTIAWNFQHVSAGYH